MSEEIIKMPEMIKTLMRSHTGDPVSVSRKRTLLLPQKGCEMPLEY
jgi:hypothetical protein